MNANEPERQFGLGHELYPVEEEDDEIIVGAQHVVPLPVYFI